jgi:eukaryotic-like serine/threonine-protein kinase
MTLERGSLLNQRYRIVEILGQGGMAAVYRAIDENLGVEVAVKENLFTTEEYARQFRREAVILANLRHPNLPRVTDHFVVDQIGQYLVMDHIEGEDLRQRMERLGSLPENEVVIIGVALCDALTYLHSRSPQVLHRDIKPGNVKISPNGQIFLVDFGLAKMVVGRQATTTGARAMTPGYSPPEQYGTARTDHRSDIYSLGATLYSALTNAIPEDGLARAMEQAELTPLTKRAPKITRRLANALEKALEVRPDDRYQSAEEFKTELLNSRSTTRRKLPLELMVDPAPTGPQNLTDAAVDEPESPVDVELAAMPVSTAVDEDVPPPPVRPSPKKSKKRKGNVLRSILIWLLFFMLAATGAIYYFDPNLPRQVWDSIAPLVLVAAAPTSTASPTRTTGDLIALTTDEPSGTFTPSPSRTATRTPNPTRTSTITPTFTATLLPSPTVSPTLIGGGVGQIAFASDREDGIPNIWVINVDGNGLVQLTNIPEGACQPSWSPDGVRLAFTAPCRRNRESYAGSSIYTINVDGSGMSQLPINPGDGYDPVWSPDGTKMAFVSLRVGGIPQVFIYDFTDNSVTQLADVTLKNNTQPVWSADGKMIAYVGSDNQIRVMKTDGTERFILSRNSSDFKNAEPIWSPDGQVVIFTQMIPDGSTVWLMLVPYSTDGGLPIKIPNSDYLSEVSFSPDGFWIAATGYPEGQRDLYILTSSGVNRTKITNDIFNDFDPAWRPMIPPSP